MEFKVKQLEFEDSRELQIKFFMDLWNQCEATFHDETLKASDRDKTLILINHFLPIL